MNRFHPIGCAVEIPHAYDVCSGEMLSSYTHLRQVGIRSPTLGGGYHTYKTKVTRYLP